MVSGTVVDLSKYIDTQFFGDRPHVRGRRIPVATIVQRAQANNWTITQTAYDFSLSEEEVLAALLYYKEHQDRLEQQEAEENARFDELKRAHV
ncbi:MAG: DUF433 domain-containing protein [Anaerolineae bacterium]|nr:DUF433 domain-containing protein [Anaerolineae bacterium]